MLIIPVPQKLTRNSFPFMTMLLVFVNVFVYFALQVPDARVTRHFVEAYVTSGLGQQEIPAYTDWLASRGSRSAPPTAMQLRDARYVADAGLALQHERAFRAELSGRMKSALDADAFTKWEGTRREVDAIWRKNFTERYVFVPTNTRVESYITHMFMHGDIGHLLGNMLMLVLIGLLVEPAVGALRTSAIYVVGGLGALALYLAFSPDRWAGLLGASGAIAALMGACAALYGFRKVRFFYHLLFYFDFITLPAIVVLPLWIGNEFWQWAQYRNVSNVAYFAHIGGLVAGAGFALLFRKVVVTRLANVDIRSIEAEEDLSQVAARAEEALARMQWDAAARGFEQLLAQAPDNTDYARKLFTATRAQPASARYHHAAATVLRLAAKTGNAALLAETVTAYAKHAQPLPQWQPHDMARYARLLAKNDQRALAASMIDQLLKLSTTELGRADLADLLLTIAVAMHRAGPGERARSQCYLGILESRFPDSDQLKLARQLITA